MTINIGKIVLLSGESKLYLVVECNSNGTCTISDGTDTKEVASDSLIEVSNENSFTIIPKFCGDSAIDISPARQMASKILMDSPFDNNNYYDLEDHITNVLAGKKSTFPHLSFGIFELKQSIQRIFDSIKKGLDLVDDDFDDEVLAGVIDDLLSYDDEQPLKEDIIDALKFNIAYQKYLASWYDTHDEGEPACREEFCDCEYQDEDAMEDLGLIKLMPNY